MRPIRKIRAVSTAIWRQNTGFPRLTHVQLLVVSPGGVGTTFLMKYLGTFLKVNSARDRDGLKHWPKPPTGKALAKAPPIIFVTGDPDAITRSIARRNWLTAQSAKLGCLRGVFQRGDDQRATFKRAVQTQIAAWTACQSDKILFVDYDDLWDRKAEIARHAGIDEAVFVAGFPPREERKSA